ncbi:MAG: helicase [Segetibacter sp.]|nr:helicase [Segetibacter sp.]
MVRTTSSDDFLLPSNRQKICEQIFKVIETEATISRNLLSKSVLAAWGISRLGTRLSAQFETLFLSLQLKTARYNSNVFFRKEDQDPLHYDMYRVHKTEADKREAEDLCPDEVANAVKHIVTNQISLSKEELLRETAKISGCARIGNNVEQAMMKGIEAAIKKGFVREANRRVVSV